MLLAKTHSAPRRVANILALLTAVTAAGIGGVFLGSYTGWWDWPPRPSSGFGVGCGLLGGGIVLFEMAILARKRFRGRRLGATQVWLRLHIWLGVACLPVIILHTGFHAGGALPTLTLALFLVVIASGVWGLIMQQWLPEKMLADVPWETVSSQVDFTGEHSAAEAVRLITVLVDGELPPAGGQVMLPSPVQDVRLSGRVVPLVVGQPATDLRLFTSRFLLPYLRRGRRSGSPLTSRAESERWFGRLREAAPPAAHPAVLRLQELCNARRQWDSLVRLNRWLHNWVLVHTPVSVLMTGVMSVHAVRAMKFW